MPHQSGAACLETGLHKAGAAPKRSSSCGCSYCILLLHRASVTALSVMVLNLLLHWTIMMRDMIS
eukprot:scaffold207776_cov21-Prasinocladus_malaysianus.AAC.1